MAFDIYAAITDRIIAELENGIIPWERPWTGITTGAINHVTGKPYSLMNQIMLQEPGEYLSFKQCTKEGGKVRKGAKAKMVVFWRVLSKEVTDKSGTVQRDSNGNLITRSVPVLRYFNVFHISDCEGIKEKHGIADKPRCADADTRAEEVFADYLARTQVGFESTLQNRAYYSPHKDIIRIPMREQFEKTAEYYSTLFHEATHSTGHPKRLNRLKLEPDAKNRFGGEEYSKEELVAEISAATILNELGIETQSSFRNNTAYIQSWLQHLKNDKRLIVSAASRAEKAARLILNMPNDTKESE